ncbi:MAG: T9SS type A sorting domain-containing protein [Saprospiraceae bacterium]|nr:T9SS type A sorting domain-containing protein [Saprospiraceae bacterium]
MKNLLTTTFIAFFCLSLNAQTPNWAWAKSVGGTNHDGGNDICTDASGNVYVAGYFTSPSITFGTTSIIGPSMFIVKYDALGNVLWAKSVGATSYGSTVGISTDTNGNVYISGYFHTPSITFGAFTLMNDLATYADIFVVKYDSNGNVLWAKSAGGTSDDFCTSMFTDANGNMHITGRFYSPSITFGTISLTNIDSSLHGADIFIVKYDESGNVLWAKSAGGVKTEIGQGISIDANKNVYVTGFFNSTSISFGTTTLTNVGFSDIFIVKYDPNGNVLWAKSAGGAEGEGGKSITIDSNGGIYMAVFFNSKSISFGTTTLSNANWGWSDIFIVKYDTLGNVLWEKSAGGLGDDLSSSISADSHGNVYLAGSFHSPSITFGPTTLTYVGNSDIYIVKYDASGVVKWAKSAGGNFDDICNSISNDASGNLYITGFFDSDSITFGTTPLTNVDKNDIFIAKLSSTTGIEDEKYFEYKINIFPNPFSYSITIQTNNHFKDASLNVYNINGQNVKQINNVSGNTITLNRDNLPNGIYFVRLIENNKVIVSERIVISD